MDTTTDIHVATLTEVSGIRNSAHAQDYSGSIHQYPPAYRHCFVIVGELNEHRRWNHRGTGGTCPLKLSASGAEVYRQCACVDITPWLSSFVYIYVMMYRIATLVPLPARNMTCVGR